MHTSGSGTLNELGYVIVILAALRATQTTVGDVRDRLRTPPPVAVALWLCVAIPSLVGLADHAVYRDLSRQPHAILHHGELWRLLTGAVVQDGGVAGTAFNLVVLALIATAATMAWGSVRTAGLFVIGDLGFNALATFAFQSPGGGNSGATFFLATSIVGLLLVRRGRHDASATSVVLVGAAIIAAAGIALVADDDAHGVAILAGLVAGGLLGARRPGLRTASALG